MVSSWICAVGTAANEWSYANLAPLFFVPSVSSRFVSSVRSLSLVTPTAVRERASEMGVATVDRVRDIAPRWGRSTGTTSHPAVSTTYGTVRYGRVR